MSSNLSFNVNESGNNGSTSSRTGTLTIAPRSNKPARTLQTPACILYTRTGSVPHLTIDTFETLLKGHTQTNGSTGTNAIGMQIAFEHFWETLVGDSMKRQDPSTMKPKTKGKRKIDEVDPSSPSASPSITDTKPSTPSPPIPLAKLLDVDMIKSNEAETLPSTTFPAISDYINAHPSSILFMTPRDIHYIANSVAFSQSAPKPPILNTDTQLLCISNSGNPFKISPNQYMNTILNVWQPDIILPLVDQFSMQVKPNTNRFKRIRKSVERDGMFLNHAISQIEHYRQQNQHDADSYQPCLFALLGGYDDKLGRETSAKETVQKDEFINGYAVSLCQQNEKDAQGTESLSLEEKLSVSFEPLPKGKPRMVFGVNSLEEVLKAVERGADLVSLEFIYSITEEGKAIIFNESGMETNEESWTTITSKTGSKSYQYRIIDLKSESFARDFTSLASQTCPCYACQNHTRAYTHHLLMTKEMLGRVLLMLHNTHTVKTWFSKLRNDILEGNL